SRTSIRRAPAAVRAATSATSISTTRSLAARTIARNSFEWSMMTSTAAWLIIGRAMQPLTLDFIEKLPKTDLHCHLDGSLRVGTILDLAQTQKVRLPDEDPDRLFKLIYAGEICSSLDDYL